jgi:uncharacterized protein YbbK (DUF523 family)/uncharacterized protein YbgA (DUF1722 family)
MTRPVLVVSRCLGTERCRYDGGAIRDPVVASLADHVTMLPACPEVAIGLGVPRDPVRLVARGAGVAMVQPRTGRDLTSEMRAHATAFLDALGPVDGFLLKGRSPSCGISQVPVHAPSGSRAPGRGRGLFAEAVLERHPTLAVEEEGRLGDFAIREHFLTRVFASARLRQVRSIADLVRFQATHKFLLLAHDQAGMRALGRVVANAEGLPFEVVRARYAARFHRALARRARAPARVDAFEHAFGHVSDRLGPRERRHFRDLLDRYRATRVPAGAVTTLLRSWVERFDVAWLRDQVLFEPFPESLVRLLDSGKGRAS